jgi:hypothetical protein
VPKLGKLTNKKYTPENSAERNLENPTERGAFYFLF